MFELPGLRTTGDVKKDLDQVRRYLARFVPQLEQELQQLGADGYQSALNERLEGLTAQTGARKAQTTSAAVAEHILDTNNPHGVTLRQLGYQEPQAQVYPMEDGTVITLGGLIMEIRTVEAPAMTAEAEGTVTAQEIDLGDWPVPLEEIMAAGAQLTDLSGWAGAISGMDGEHCGSITVYTAEAETDAGTIQVWAIGRQEDG